MDLQLDEIGHKVSSQKTSQGLPSPHSCICYPTFIWSVVPTEPLQHDSRWNAYQLLSRAKCVHSDFFVTSVNLQVNHKTQSKLNSKFQGKSKLVTTELAATFGMLHILVTAALKRCKLLLNLNKILTILSFWESLQIFFESK